jgi:predicted membrane channel-forming protein YqfA (hemolysin III family)
MTLRFDLSSISKRNANVCGVCEDDESSPVPIFDFPNPPTGIPSSVPLSFSLGLGAASQPPKTQTSLVRRFAAPVLQRFGVTAQEPKKKCKRGDDEENDQYTIQPGRSMCWSVLFKNDTGKKHPGSLLGDYGHVERLSAWVHLLGGIGFLVYSILRPLIITNEHTIAESLATSAAGAVAFAFLSSTVYHVTAPSKVLTIWTRQLDFLGIYTALGVGCVADFAIATRGFENVSVLSVADGPLACTVTAIFFFMRRALTSADETWSTYLGGCTLSFGLMRKGHIDLDHTGVRQSTSFLLAISYFVTIPPLYTNFGTRDATTILLLELGCLALIVVGMLVDNLIVFPDKSLAQGKGPKFLACTSCGCVGTSHSLWHLFSVAAAIKGACSREFALSLQR